ncbi:MAG: hypothetical protein ACOCV1_07385 [Bacillota bacterium]
MNKKYLTLAGRIKNEVEEIEEIIAKINRGWEKYKSNNDELYLDSVALNLHDYYSTFEKIFELVANEIDESLPAGASWHKELLKQMSVSIKNVRPKVISKESREKLEEFRGFRHIVRNVYSYQFSGDKIKKLLNKLDDFNAQLIDEIENFIKFLEKVANE